MSFAFDDPAPSYPTIPALQMHSTLSDFAPSWNDDLLSPPPHQPPQSVPESNWTGWGTESGKDNSEIQWHWDTQPSSAHAISPSPHNNSDTLCDTTSLPSYMAQKTPPTTACEECSHLINQITTVLQENESLQRELLTNKQHLEIYRGDMALLLSLEDCDFFENEIYHLLYKIKEKKVRFPHSKPF
jgi:hypothetical protein